MGQEVHTKEQTPSMLVRKYLLNSLAKDLQSGTEHQVSSQVIMEDHFFFHKYGFACGKHSQSIFLFNLKISLSFSMKTVSQFVTCNV